MKPLLFSKKGPKASEKAVFNLESGQNGSYVPHGILNWVISKMVWVRL